MNTYPIIVDARADRGEVRVSVRLFEADSGAREQLEPAVMALADTLRELGGPLVSVRFLVRPDIEYERAARKAAESDANAWRAVAEELEALQ